MSLFSDDRYTWRETYFVLFDPVKRPRLADVQRELRSFAGTLKVLDGFAEPDGTLKSMTIASYEDHAALEIIFQQGDAVEQEIVALIDMLLTGAKGKEKEKLKKAQTCRAKLDILHFEQTAGTAAFKVVKRPELKFAPPSLSTGSKTKKPIGDSFSNEQLGDKLRPSQPRKKVRFRFDPDNYENCLDDGAGAELDRLEADDAEPVERIDPNTLVLVLEVLCRLTDGIGIDPASGGVV